MKLKKFAALVLFSFMISSVFYSCNDDEEINYGILRIDDIKDLKVGDSIDINPQFSVAEYATRINYTFEGNDIFINNDKVFALNGGKTVEVTAETPHHTTNFTVKTLSEFTPDIELTIKDVNAWVGYPASEFFPKIDGQNISETISFEYDNTKITIDAVKNTVQALAAGIHTVTASFDGISTEFNVHSYTVNKSSDKFNTSPYDSYASSLAQRWKDEEAGNTTTLFIGDSFFDVRNFWTNFYATYAGKDALCFGISSTTSYDWEIYLDSWLGKLDPKNIVMHIGTNNVYDDNDSADEAILSLQRMFTLMHSKMPDTKVYYFGISQRNYDTGRINIVNIINTEMKLWCEERSWITYLNTPEKLTTDMLRDGIHPLLEYYSIFVDELNASGIIFESKAVSAEINDITRNVSQAIGDNSVTVLYKGAALTNNYILSGKIDITKLGNNAHFEFDFLGQHGEKRMLLWNNESNNKLKVGYAYNGHDAGTPVYDFTPGQTLTLDFTLIYANNNAYWYINNDLVLVFVNATGTGSANILGISSENMECKFYNMTAISKDFDNQEYTTALATYQETINLYSGKSAGAYRP